MIPVCSSIEIVEVSGEIDFILYVSPSGDPLRIGAPDTYAWSFSTLTDAGLYVNVSGLEIMLNVTAFSYIPAPASVVNLRFNTYLPGRISPSYLSLTVIFPVLEIAKYSFPSSWMISYLLMCTCVPSSVFTWALADSL